MLQFPAQIARNPGAIETIATLSILKGEKVAFLEPTQKIHDLFSSMATASGGHYEPGENKGVFQPNTPWKTGDVRCKGQWTMGEMMGILSIPMAAGIIPSSLSFHGPTHREGQVGVSHIAEGFLPMMDRRGTRSYVEVSAWGEQGEALMEVRPPLQGLRDANLRVRGHVVEVRALISHGAGQEASAHRLVEEAESELERVGLDFPEVEKHQATGWSGSPRVFVRIEYGNIRVLGESFMKPGDTPKAVAQRAVAQVMDSPCHGGSLQSLWALPLFLSALISEGGPSTFPPVEHHWGDSLSQLIQQFMSNAEITLHELSTTLFLPGGAMNSHSGGCDSPAICYPSRKKNEEIQ